MSTETIKLIGFCAGFLILLGIFVTVMTIGSIRKFTDAIREDERMNREEQENDTGERI